ncbi:uncharacterized protein VTP21DRAFT_6490 [Calcarisporiella thermophila]|uniref:uncharacterized protein n=1 Tax=Calcarisporiella thermophila TaxID=911321 RepID=UPI003743CDF1
MLRSTLSRHLSQSSRYITRQSPVIGAPRALFSSTNLRFQQQNARNNGSSTRNQGVNPFALLAVASVGFATFYMITKNRSNNAPIEPKLDGPKGNKLEPDTSDNTSKAITKIAEDTTVIFVLGGPGAGKGTQCAKLVSDFGFVHLSAGDLLREEQKRPGSQFGELINTYIKEGRIVPMEVTIALLENAMKASGGKRFLIDGFPRKLDQAHKFEEVVIPSKFVLYFECPEEIMLERLLKRGETSGRVDDNIESIKKRFRTFRETSFPVITHYEQKGKVHTVSCRNTPEDVYSEVREIFNNLFGENK